MFFRFEFSRLFVAATAFAIIAAGIPAYGAGRNSEVEVDLSVLQNLPHRPQPIQLIPPPLVDNPEPVEVTPLQPGEVSHATPVSLQPPVSAPEKPAATPTKPAPPKAKTVHKVHKAAVIKRKKKPPAAHRHPAHPQIHKPQVAKAKTPDKPSATVAAVPPPAKMPSSMDAPKKNPAPDNKKPAADIEDISEVPNTRPQAPVAYAPPQPVAIKTIPSGPMPAAPVAPVIAVPEKTAQVPPQTPPAPPPPAVIKTAPVSVPPAASAKTAKEKMIPPTSDIAQPPAEKENVPSPPPADPREASHFSLLFQAGVSDQLDNPITSTLQSQILPLLKNHPAWRLRINAFASPVDNEPISARRVSLARALAVRSWLLDKGVAARRMDVRAAGLETGHEPADRVDIVFLDPDGG